MTEITPPQRRTLAMIASMSGLRGIPPTLQELSAKLGISIASIYNQVSQLVRKGYLRRQHRKARSFEVVSTPKGTPEITVTPLKVVGHVAGGRPILAAENIIGEVLVESHIVEHGPCFALKVKGDSMVGAGIRDGDYCVVRQQPAADSGDIVVAILGDEGTVKRLSITEDGVALVPENAKFQPIRVGPEDDFRIVGKVIAVRRPAATPA